MWVSSSARPCASHLELLAPVLAGLGKVAAAERSYERAARLFGAAERTREDDPTRQPFVALSVERTNWTQPSIDRYPR